MSGFPKYIVWQSIICLKNGIGKHGIFMKKKHFLGNFEDNNIFENCSDFF